jgi:hypothetical protein
LLLRWKAWQKQGNFELANGKSYGHQKRLALVNRFFIVPSAVAPPFL